MRGKQLEYIVKKGCSAKFHHELFGRLSISSKQKPGYYVPGVFHEIPYFKIFNGRIFIGTTGDIDFDPVMGYCDSFILTEAVKDNNNVFLKTAEERWKFIAGERGYKIEWSK